MFAKHRLSGVAFSAHRAHVGLVDALLDVVRLEHVLLLGPAVRVHQIADGADPLRRDGHLVDGHLVLAQLREGGEGGRRVAVLAVELHVLAHAAAGVTVLDAPLGAREVFGVEDLPAVVALDQVCIFVACNAR